MAESIMMRFFEGIGWLTAIKLAMIKEGRRWEVANAIGNYRRASARQNNTRKMPHRHKEIGIW
jgi:hypothetical protein